MLVLQTFPGCEIFLGAFVEARNTTDSLTQRFGEVQTFDELEAAYKALLLLRDMSCLRQHSIPGALQLIARGGDSCS